MSGRPLSRRRVLQAGVAGTAGVLLPNLRTHVALSASGPDAPALVVVFLRGGMDGLTAVVPVHERAYYEARPSSAIPAARTKRLDDRFGLHPALTALLPLWSDGRLAIVHGAGVSDETRSHFDAQRLVERGGPPSLRTGWLARHLLVAGSAAPLNAVAIGAVPPSSLQGSRDATTLRSVADLGLVAANDADERRRLRAIAAMHADTTEALRDRTRDAVAAVDALRGVRQRPPATSRGARYPTSPLGADLQLVAQLIKADVGVGVAHVDVGGWDHHYAMGTYASGPMARSLDDLARGLAAFWTDLGAHARRTTVVAVSEFGRTLRENGSGGLDHGRGGAMFVIGDGVRGGRVHGEWRGLAADALDGGDLAVTTDVSDVFAEIVALRLRNPRWREVFPGPPPRFVGIVSG